jgi:hypothetical protein
LVDPLSSLALTLHGRTLAFVRAQLSVVSNLLALVRDSVPLIGGAISFVSDPLAPRELMLTPAESRLAVFQLRNAPVDFARVVTIFTEHGLP